MHEKYSTISEIASGNYKRDDAAAKSSAVAAGVVIVFAVAVLVAFTRPLSARPEIPVFTADTNTGLMGEIKLSNLKIAGKEVFDDSSLTLESTNERYETLTFVEAGEAIVIVFNDGRIEYAPDASCEDALRLTAGVFDAATHSTNQPRKPVTRPRVTSTKRDTQTPSRPLIVEDPL